MRGIFGKKLILLRIIAGVFLFTSLTFRCMQQAFAETTHLSRDPVLEEYIENTIPDNSERLPVQVATEYVRLKSDKKIEPYEIETQVYAYSGKSEIYTIVSIAFSNEIRITSEDRIRITIKDSIWPISPSKGVLYVKDKEGQEWVEKKQIIPMELGQWVDISGSEMSNRANYSRIIVSFPSLDNPETAENPCYYIQYVNYDSGHRYGLIIILIIIFLVMIHFWFIYRKRRLLTGGNEIV